ncbi:MAG TPA: GGDEF domain-containing protein [Rectinemataceae bacterium]
MEKSEPPYGVVALAILVVIVLPALLILEGFLLFHALTENLVIIINIILFIIGTRTYRYSKDSKLLFMSTAFIFVASLGVFHTLTYKGVNLIAGVDASMATQFWIARRLLESACILGATYVGKREFSFLRLNLLFFAITLALVLSIFGGWFPACYVEGIGLTTFKKLASYTIIALNIFALFRLKTFGASPHDLFKKVVGWALGLSAAAEFMFTLYSSVYDEFNVIGHLLYLFSSGLLVVYVVRKGLDQPYDSMFKEVYEKAIRDLLTGLYNRHGFEEMAHASFERAKRFPAAFTLVLMDLDNFKSINDDFGHAEGDLALVEFARLLKESFREYDLVARLGGDEFVVLMEDGIDLAQAAIRRLEKNTEIWKLKDPRREKLGLTFGTSLRPAGSDRGLGELITEADAMLLEEKSRKRQEKVQQGVRADEYR